MQNTYDDKMEELRQLQEQHGGLMGQGRLPVMKRIENDYGGDQMMGQPWFGREQQPAGTRYGQPGPTSSLHNRARAFNQRGQPPVQQPFDTDAESREKSRSRSRSLNNNKKLQERYRNVASGKSRGAT